MALVTVPTVDMPVPTPMVAASSGRQWARSSEK